MKRLKIFGLVAVLGLVFTAVAWAVDPPDDGQNGPSPDPGFFVQTPPEGAAEGTHWCGLNQYYPWHRYYAPWNQWYIQARTLVSCKYKSGSIWLPLNVYSITIVSSLDRAPEFLAFQEVDSDSGFVTNDSITSVRNVYNCNGKLRNTQYRLHSFAVVDEDGLIETNPYEWEWELTSPTTIASCN